MKKTDTLMKVVSLLVFIALAAYLTTYIIHRAMNPVQTALTVTATMSESAPMSGLVVRNELLIKSGEQYIDVTATDGMKVAAEATVATAYSSEEALERASRLHVLEREIAEVTRALSSAGNIQVTGDREQSIFNAISSLSYSLRSGGLSEVDSLSSALAGIIFPSDSGVNATDEYLWQLEKEYNQLAYTSAGDTSSITVSQSGTFSTVVDGYEGVDPDYAKSLSPSELRELIAANRVVDNASLGKLITSYNWYYAGILPRQNARDLLADDRVQLSFGRYYGGELDATVEWVGRAEGDEQLVLFRMNKGLTDMLAVRAVSAELIYQQFTGLRVPIRGLYRYYAGYMADADGQQITEGQSVILTMGEENIDAFVSEIGGAYRYGDLPKGVEEGSEADTRPKRRLVVFCWPWTEEDGPADSSAGMGTVTDPETGAQFTVVNYYAYRVEKENIPEDMDENDPDRWIIPDRLCVFTMTGLQAERKLVELVFAGEEYCLLSSSGDDALREGNEVIIAARNLYNGRVFS